VKRPTWATARDPLCWFLGAATFGFLVVENRPIPIFVGAAVALMGIPGAIGLDEMRRERKRSSGTMRSHSSGSSSSRAESSASSSGGEGNESV